MTNQADEFPSNQIDNLIDLQPRSSDVAAAGVKIAILGCGKLGTAVLLGFLSASFHDSSVPIQSIIVTVRTSQSKKRITRELVDKFGPDWSSCTTTRVDILLQDQNAYAVSSAGIVILGCKPFAYRELLSDHDTRNALNDSQTKKILASMLGGVTIADIQQQLHMPNTGDRADTAPPTFCEVARAIPNIAAQIRESVTMISVQRPMHSNQHSYQGDNSTEQTLTQLFNRLGRTEIIPETSINAATSLSASALAFFADLIDAAASGTLLHSSIPAEQALRISAHAACGAAGLMTSAGFSAEQIKELVATKGGSTRRGLDVMHAAKVVGSVQEAMSVTIQAVEGLSRHRPLQDGEATKP